MFTETFDAIKEATALPQTNIDASDYAEIIADLESEITERRWEIGTVAIDAVEAGQTITELARATRIPRSTIDSYYQNTKFYPEGDREFLMEYEGFTWSILSDTRKFILSDNNTTWRKDIHGLHSFLNHCANGGSVTADQVKREIAIACQKPKPRKKLATGGIRLRKNFGKWEAFLLSLTELKDDFKPGDYEFDVFEVTT